MKANAITLLILTSLATSISAAPARPDFCKNFKKVVAAASENPPFSSISGPVIDRSYRKAKIALPGFADCQVEGYLYDNPGYVCVIPGLTRPLADAKVAETRAKVETCLGGKMEKDYDRSTQPLVLHTGATTYPMAWTNVLRNGDVAVGFVASYRQPR